MHVHASDKILSSTNSAKLYVYDNGDTLVQHKGMVSDTDMKLIQEYIKLNHEQMYKKWKNYSENGYYKKDEIQNTISKQKNNYSRGSR